MQKEGISRLFECQGRDAESLFLILILEQQKMINELIVKLSDMKK